MKGSLKYILALTATALLGGCINNDIPFPVIKLAVVSIEAEGTSGACIIDNNAQTVTIPLEETTDIRNVEITSIEYTERARPSQDMVGTFDMRVPQYLTLSLYQDYEWTIQAQQTIERYFTVEGQIGNTEFDVDNCMATAYMRDDYDLGNVKVMSLKLGPRDITEMSPSAEELTDFNSVRFVDVSYHGRTERWTLSVKPKALSVEIQSLMAGSQAAWVTASGISGTDMGIRYRKAGEEQWTDAPDEWVSVSGGTFTVKMRHLEPETGYEVIAYADESTSDVKSFTTGELYIIPNGGFENWHLTSKNVYNPYLEDEAPYWGTGNQGSAIAGVNITTPVDNDLHEGTTGKYCAQLKSTLASVAGIGKFAAGNIYTGVYAQTIGTNGLVDFGRPYTLRPTGFRFWAKYNQGVINCVPSNNKSPVKEGDMDEGIVYVALGYWGDPSVVGESPVRVDTRDVSTFFNPANPNIIAYGEKVFDSSCAEWTEFDIDLEYRSDLTPSHIIIVCTSSRYGDYFVGSSNSIMWVDDFELKYDFDD